MKKFFGIPLLFLFALSLSAATPKPQGPYYGVFRELPITDITPEGWLAQFLQRQRDGLATHYKVCGFPFDTCLWMGNDPDFGWGNYAETAYLIDGVYRCGLLLKDKSLIDLGEQNVRYVLDHPTPDGRLGPQPETFVARVPKDYWCYSFIFFTRVMMEEYEVTGNPEILQALTRHYLALPANFGAGREVDSVEGMCWLYGKTGDQRLLDKAELSYKNFTASPKSQWMLSTLAAGVKLRGHGVSVCEATKQPALLYLYTGKKAYLDAVVGGFNALQRDDEMVDGVITSDSALSGKKPDHEHETCCVSDYSWSLGYLLQASGDAKWADTIERCVFNAGIGVVDKEFKTAQYYASPNQVVATNDSMTPTTGKRGREMQAYRPDMSVQCCTGNIHRFMPNYAARMWMSNGKGGLAATLYGPSTLHAAVGTENTPVTIQEKTDYPFDGAISLKITAEKPVHFPLYVRIPGWADAATLSVNGKPVADKLISATFYKLDRTFASGDVVALGFPMKVKMENPVPEGVALTRGPLVYTLKVKVDAKVSTVKTKNTHLQDPNFPAWDLTAASPWNYALLLKGPEDLDKVKVSVRSLKEFPWTPEGSPVGLTVPARRVPAWQLGEGTSKAGAAIATNPPLPQPPLQLAAETEQVELIPEGATQLRIAVFPNAFAGPSVR